MELLQQFSHAKVIMTDNEPSFTYAQFNHKDVVYLYIPQTPDTVPQTEKLKGTFNIKRTSSLHKERI